MQEKEVKRVVSANCGWQSDHRRGDLEVRGAPPGPGHALRSGSRQAVVYQTGQAEVRARAPQGFKARFPGARAGFLSASNGSLFQLYPRSPCAAHAVLPPQPRDHPARQCRPPLCCSEPLGSKVRPGQFLLEKREFERRQSLTGRGAWPMSWRRGAAYAWRLRLCPDLTCAAELERERVAGPGGRRA